MVLTKRTALDLGWECNADCKFCYYKDSPKKINLSKKILKKRLRKAKKYGIRSIEFTGGEPTLRKDLFEIIKYAKKLGFKRLGLISNGTNLSNLNFIKKLKDSGIEEIKFSIHSSNPKIQDEITGLNDSLKNILEGIENAKKVGINIKTNTVIGQFNYLNLSEIAQFLIQLKPKRINFKLITPILEAKNLKNNLIAPYSKIAPELHKALKKIEKTKIKTAVRYIPFCFMKNYEHHVYNLNQVQYDLDEWDYEIKNKLEYGSFLSSLSSIIGFLNTLRLSLLKGKFLSANNYVIQSKLLRLNTKNNSCKNCKYDLICDGLWIKYAQLYGYSELKPVKGKKINDPAYFIRKY